MQVMLFGLGLLAMLLGWRYAWKPTALDATRDRLFDLRNVVRHEFISKGWGLDHPMYKALRDLLNGHLRYTEQVHFFGFVAFLAAMAGSRELNETRKAYVDSRLSCDDADVSRFCGSVREKAAMIMLMYMIETSAIAIFLVICGTAIIAARHAGNGIARIFSREAKACSRSARAAAVASALLVTLQPAHASREEVRVFMEDHALSAI